MSSARLKINYAAFTTSPAAHANIDTTAALRVPGVKAVIISAGIGPGKRIGRAVYDLPVLAYDKVVFIWDRVAAVAAETREAAQEAARLVEVEYDELPALIDPFEALADGAPIIHPQRDAYFFSGKKLPNRSHSCSIPRIAGQEVRPEISLLEAAVDRARS